MATYSGSATGAELDQVPQLITDVDGLKNGWEVVVSGDTVSSASSYSKSFDKTYKRIAVFIKNCVGSASTTVIYYNFCATSPTLSTRNGYFNATTTSAYVLIEGLHGDLAETSRTYFCSISETNKATEFAFFRDNSNDGYKDITGFYLLPETSGNTFSGTITIYGSEY